MVSLSDIHASNVQIPKTLPAGLVAVFVGGTNGIGEITMKHFAKLAVKPKIYFVGRAQEAGTRIENELKEINPDGTYAFIKSDTSLVKNVDSVCQEIKNKEKSVNLLFITTGTLSSGQDTSEGLHLPTSLVLYSRTRFIVNLLPLLKAATSLRRVISVYAGTKEGAIIDTDFQCRNVSLTKIRGHTSSLITLSLEQIAKTAPDVSFIHVFPGSVRSGITRGSGLLLMIARAVFTVIGRFVYMSEEDCGERQVFFSTSARYPAKNEADTGIELAEGTNGEMGSGVYSVDENGEPASNAVVKMLAKLRENGTDLKLWNHINEEFVRITGTTVMQ
ncbi:hypothetical protein K493DRAFT_231584 [Basidiobolus meristosporus CBS 931.73]|uniref:NAD(P)-binding protein n=1 Tax=Basidiobolus meristosporus CBS 931.73 TaxID=1314790 RepID=A0A1Y1XWH8_9FUNG|nr:hypothetical protein K493DRAFT_231584 [Basidiobolus meristosporus CBS 931.73]|eukprot:ORX90100.1 hypothetical protein K493DRAFT_231584 [Basidiobolus meristosporus CBS 931.73]